MPDGRFEFRCEGGEVRGLRWVSAEYVSARCNAGRHDLCNVVSCACECHLMED